MKNVSIIESTKDREQAIEVVLLLGILCAYAYLVPEAPHMDGVRWARSLEIHQLEVNPNYLLMQPVALALYLAWEQLGLPLNATLFQKVIDVIAGLSSLAIFSVCLRRIEVPFSTRIFAIVLMAFSYNFFYLSTSDHIKVLTSPFLMLTLLFLIRHLQEGSLGSIFLAGIFLGMSICTLINAVIWFVFLIPVLLIWHPTPFSDRFKRVALFVLSTNVVILLFFVGFYLSSSREVSFLRWIVAYGADPDARDVGFGGVSFITVGRAIFALVRNFVYPSDIGASVRGWIGEGPSALSLGKLPVLSIVSVVGVALLLARCTLWGVANYHVLNRIDRCVLLVASSAIVSYFVFGFFWNSAEEEFWFQITGPILLVVGLWIKYCSQNWLEKPFFLTIVAVVVVNNLIGFAIPRKAYPYGAYVKQIGAVIRAGDVVIYDGSEPIGSVMYGVRRDYGGHYMIGLMPILEKNRYDIAKALDEIEEELAKARGRGRRVYVIGIFSVSPLSHPWSLLWRAFRIRPDPFIELLRRQGAYEPGNLAGQEVWILSSGAKDGSIDESQSQG